MADTPLDPRELQAIQQAIREARSTPERPSSSRSEEVTTLALIADDRAAESARPAGMRIAERWVVHAKRRMRHYLSSELEINVLNAETIEGPAVRDELASMWLCAVDSGDRRGRALMAAGGSMIADLAARLLGATEEEDDEEELDEEEDEPERAPSATSLSVFRPIGVALAEALAIAWSDEQGCKARAVPDAAAADETRNALLDADVLIAVTVSIQGAVRGRVRLLAQPATLVRPETPIEAIPAAPGAIDEALGEVPVDVRVEFGRAQLSMRDIASLKVGSVIPLSVFIDDLLPVHCAGVVKAHGRAVVYRGVLAVEVAEPATQSSRSKAA